MLEIPLSMKNILVALDMKPTDQLLMEQATFLAEKCESKIWLIHVASPDPDFVGFEMGPKYIRDFVAGELRTEHRQLRTYVEELEGKSQDVEGLLIQGPTIDMIEEEIRKLNIDLLVIGSHKHSFLYETFVGDTALRIVREISIPVMIVPLPDDKS
jgi:nucleotide-binding universal stress UspA family protein